MNARRVLKLQKRVAQLRLARQVTQRWLHRIRTNPRLERYDPEARSRLQKALSQLNGSLKRMVKLLKFQGARPVTGALAEQLAHHADRAPSEV